MARSDVPTYDQLMNPTLKALHDLGGSGTVEEIYGKVVEITGLMDTQLEILHAPERGTQTEVEYRLAWARTYLKKYGLLENSSRGVWALTAQGTDTREVNTQDVKQYVINLVRSASPNKQDTNKRDADLSVVMNEEEIIEQSWRDKAIATLLAMDPSAFERLIQRLLRESGFIQVEVTGRSGDQGVDGKGIMRIGGLLSFPIIFQCKRYKGTVSPSEIRDFRGTMQGRADKGLFVTTGNFSRDAVKEATRDGAPPIDLLDGERLVDKLKELSLGIKTTQQIVEQVTVDEAWFHGL